MKVEKEDLKSAIKVLENTIDKMDKNQNKLELGVNAIENSWDDANGKKMKSVYLRCKMSLYDLNDRLANNVKPKLESALEYIEEYEK